MPMAFETPSTPDAPYEIRPNDPMSETQHFGGAGLSGSPRSYLKLIRTLLKGGELDGARILRKETVDLMFKEQFTTDEQRQAFHQMAQLNFDPAIRKSGKVDPATTHGYGGGLHAQSETGKSAGTLSWSGMAVSPICLAAKVKACRLTCAPCFCTRRTRTGGSTETTTSQPSFSPMCFRSALDASWRPGTR